MVKLLYISNTAKGSFNRTLDSIKGMDGIDLTVIYRWRLPHKEGYIERVFNKLKMPLDFDDVNERVKAVSGAFDYIVVPKGNFIKPNTLIRLKENNPGAILISWSLDDMYAWHNRSIFYTLGLKIYDLVVTTKSFNIQELPRLGAKKILYVNQPYSERYHKPNKDDGGIQHDVIFIGHSESDRFNKMLFLAKNGVEINIYGPGWDDKKYIDAHPNLKVHKKQLIGDEYSKAISNSKVTLCFLRKLNRDLHTSRSVEIPACKGLMIAERTIEHSALFEEDKEALYFSNQEELLSKVNEMLDNEAKRIAIASAGYLRCTNSGYGYDNMFRKILCEADKIIKKI